MHKNRKKFIREMARKIHKKFKILNPPIMTKDIVRKLGYSYKESMYLPSEIYAYTLSVNDNLYIIVDKKSSINRKRFLISHELGHILLNHKLEWKLPEFTIDDPPTNDHINNIPKEIESEAHCFAGELLVPWNLLKEEYNKNTDIPHLAEVFKVSREVLSIQLSNYFQYLS